MSLEKLLWMLQQRRLHFCQMKQFRDPYEGAAPIGMQWACSVDLETAFVGYLKDEHIHEYLYVNCWHSNTDESAAMWSLYSNDCGVAIVTTLDRLRSALEIAAQEIEIAAVRYEAITPGFMAGSPWRIKRPSFAHEREVRAVIRDSDCGAPGIGVPVDLEALIDKIQVSPDSEPWVESVVTEVAMKYGVRSNVSRSALYTLK
jgi:hypothetical protein